MEKQGNLLGLNEECPISQTKDADFIKNLGPCGKVGKDKTSGIKKKKKEKKERKTIKQMQFTTN